jgi:hypothetical protein
VLTTKTMIDHCFHLAITAQANAGNATCNVLIEPPLHEFDMFNVKNADRIVEIGYNTAAKQKEKLVALAKKINTQNAI